MFLMKSARFPCSPTDARPTSWFRQSVNRKSPLAINHEAVGHSPKKSSPFSNIIHPKNLHLLIHLDQQHTRPFLPGVSLTFFFVSLADAASVSASVVTIMFLYTLRAGLNEFVEARSKSWRNYIFSVWNVFDLTLCVLNLVLLITFCFPFGPAAGEMLSTVTSIGVLLVWQKALYFMLPFRNVGAFIRMVLEIFMDIRYFLLVCVVTLGGFGSAFFVLFKEDWREQLAGGTQKMRALAEQSAGGDIGLTLINGTSSSISSSTGGLQSTPTGRSWLATEQYVKAESPDDLPLFPNVPQTLLRMYVLMLGDWELSSFTHSVHYVLAPILFFLFTFVMMVVLFNLLIAIMGDTFQRVKSDEEAEFLKTRAETIVDMEKLRWRPVSYPSHIHALLPKKEEVNVAGRLYFFFSCRTRLCAGVNIGIHFVLGIFEHDEDHRA